MSQHSLYYKHRLEALKVELQRYYSYVVQRRHQHHMCHVSSSLISQKLATYLTVINFLRCLGHILLLSIFLGQRQFQRTFLRSEVGCHFAGSRVIHHGVRAVERLSVHLDPRTFESVRDL